MGTVDKKPARRHPESLKIEATGKIGSGKVRNWPTSLVGVIARLTRQGRQVHGITDLHSGPSTKGDPAMSKAEMLEPTMLPETLRETAGGVR